MQIFLWAITEQMVAGVGYARNLEVLRHLKSEVDAYFHTIFASPTVLWTNSDSVCIPNAKVCEIETCFS